MEGSSVNFRLEIFPIFQNTQFCFQNFIMRTSFRKTINNFLCFLIFLVYLEFRLCCAANTISQGQFIRDGDTIISPGQKFELGFFSPGNSTFRYVGIWYHNISKQSVIWVANRENPISGDSGVLTIEENGQLVVMDGDNNTVWSSNSSATQNATAALMDNGNLSINVSTKVLWNSFSYPTDTFLPEMEVHMTVGADEKKIFTSWKNESDPSLGQFLMGVDPRASPQIVIWDGAKRHWRSGQWDGQIFIGMPYMSSQYLYGFKVINEGTGKYYIQYTTSTESDLIRFKIGWDGHGEQLRWDTGENNWDILKLEPEDDCEVYNFCGAFGICKNETGSPVCSCTEKFEPRDADGWEKGNWTGGCVRKTELQCGRNENGVGIGDSDGFLKVEGVKWPDFADVVEANDEDDCKEECLKNCSCNAYMFSKSIGCIVWSDDLVDMHHFDQGGGDFYVRVASSDLDTENKTKNIVIIVAMVVVVLLISVSAFLLWRFRKNIEVTSSWWGRIQVPVSAASRDYSTDFSGNELNCVERQAGSELSLFSFSDILAATSNLSNGNILGKGGFGPVYKGNLLGEEIAVKRLSKKSGQGLEEFKNEVILIAKLQHRNLVRILGCCIEGNERMLVYEYVQNKSLDSFIFDSTKQAQLDWPKRFMIIEGIARGLVYLHRDSRLRIIHRDLKASNILLDDEMNPKISDFGMAKIFGKNVNEASTSRVVGTFGYLAPEYAMEGLFSVKSDVYSFGVLLLEIVSGRRNVSFRSPEYSSIIGYAWDLFYGGKAMELVNPSIADTCHENQVLRCVHIAMLCVQDSADHRPTMSSVVLMLESENITLPMPKEPTYTSMRRSGDVGASKDSYEVVSSNNVTMSMIIGR